MAAKSIGVGGRHGVKKCCQMEMAHVYHGASNQMVSRVFQRLHYYCCLMYKPENPRNLWFIFETKPDLLVARRRRLEGEVTILMPATFASAKLVYPDISILCRKAVTKTPTCKPIAVHILLGG